MERSLADQAKDVGRVLWGTLNAFRHERGTTTAAALAYSTFLSLIPICLLLLIVVDPLAAALTAESVPGAGEAAADGAQGQHFLDALLGAIAPAARDDILGYLNQTAEGLRDNKGSLGLLGFGGFIVTSVLLFIAIEDALNDVWKSPRRRKLGVRIAYFWCVATLVPIAVLFSMSAVSRQPLLGDVMNAAGMREAVQWCVSLLLMGGMYVVFPVAKVSWRAAFWGAVLSATLFELSKWGFGEYVRSAIQYKALYGSLAVIPLFIVWTYIGWAVVLLGAHLARIIDGGLPKPKTPPAPERVAFAVAIEVARHFVDGKGPMSTADVSSHLGMEPDAVESASKRLCRAGILAEVEQHEDGEAMLLLPAKDPRELPAVDLVVAARDAGNEEVGGTELKAALRLMDDAARAASAGLTLGSLAGGATAPPARPDPIAVHEPVKRAAPAPPLAGLTVLVTRPGDRAQKLRGMLEAHGAAVVVAPTIAVRPEPLDGDGEFAAAWRDRGSFDWLVVVSPTTAQLICAAVDRDGLEGLPPVASVGPGTTQGLREGGIEVRFQPEQATSFALTAGLTAFGAIAGARVLWPMADIGRTDGVQALRDAGAAVVAPVAYRTTPLKPATEAIDRSDLVLLASPSAVEGYLLGESAKTRALPVIAIGPTTAEAVTAAGLTLAGVADPHTSEGLVQAVLAWAATR